MDLTSSQRKLIFDQIEKIFETAKANLLGRHFQGPRIFFQVANKADPFHTIEGIYHYTLNMLYGAGATPDNKIVENLAEITGNYFDAQKLKVKNHILADVLKAKNPTEAVNMVKTHFDKAEKYVNMLVANETRITQAYASREGITKVASDIGVEDPTVIFLGVTDNKICKYCKSMYHDAKNIRMPKPYKLSQVREGYFKPKEHDGKTPHQAPLHPNCFDKETEVLTDSGWKFFKDLTGEERFLSMNMETGEAEWSKAISKIEYEYEGDLIHFTNKTTNLMVTPNHINPILKRKSNKNGKWYEKKMIETDHLLHTGEWGFITAPEYWIGDSNDILLDQKAYDRKLFCEFMGYFISEGCLSKASKSTFRIEITQFKHPEPMISCVKKLFNKNEVYYKHGKIIIWMNDDQKELFDLLNLGKSWEKYVPDIIKNSNQECLRIFLNSYLLGDGSTRSVHKLSGQKIPSIERVYYTSSDKIASDLGEIILKVGRRPSYTAPKEGKLTKHRNGAYLTKHPTWTVRELNPSSPKKENLKIEAVKYKDAVYDVHLFKNNTLFVRREGKVQLSGNCRHSMSFVPPNFGFTPSGVIEFKNIGYDYYKDYWSINKSEEPTLAPMPEFTGYNEYLDYNLDHKHS